MRFNLPRTRVKAALIALAIIVLLMPFEVYLWGRETLPQMRGDTKIAALTGDVEIVRDDYGIPYIFAPDWRNAYVALGYLHAQDRLWQMEMMRRAGAGRLSEILGKSTLKTDMLFRTLGLYANAAESYGALSADVQGALQAYAAGVNAFIAQDKLPMEFHLLNFKPAPWQPADSLVWMKLMAYQLGGSWRDEIDAARLTNHADIDRVGHLLGWDENPNNQKLFGDKIKHPQHTSVIDWKKLAASLPPHGPRSASNGWVVSPRLTKDGIAELANDPHLNLGMPAIWYLARIVTPQGSVTGATAPGMPFHVLGQNDELAWGITSTGADTADLYIEPSVNPEQYRSPYGVETYTMHTETIDVKGEPRVMLDIRHTRHGVVISDLGETAAIKGDKNVVALAATFLRGDDTGAEALYKLNRAHTPADVEEAVRYVQAPVQNLFFADVRGNIGMRVVGSIPKRGKGNGAYPVDGTKTEYDWNGVIPRMDLPRWTNPAQGYVSNANEPTIESNYPFLITSLWLEPYRGERLKQILDKAPNGSITPEIMATWQNDLYSLPAIALRNQIIAALPAPQDDIDKKAYKILKEWDGAYSHDAKAPLIMTYLQSALLVSVLGDEFQGDLDALRPVHIGVIMRALNDKKTDWCDDMTTKDIKEDCPHAIQVAWQNTLAALKDEYGSDTGNWEWHKVNIAPLENRFWQQVPLVGRMVDAAVPVDGGPTTLKRADHYASDPKQLMGVSHAAGFRGLYRAGDPDDGRYIIAGGQSANIMSSNYADQIGLWAKGKSLYIKGSLPELEKQYGRYLTLIAPEKNNE